MKGGGYCFGKRTNSCVVFFFLFDMGSCQRDLMMMMMMMMVGMKAMVDGVCLAPTAVLLLALEI